MWECEVESNRNRIRSCQVASRNSRPVRLRLNLHHDPDRLFSSCGPGGFLIFSADHGWEQRNPMYPGRVV